MFGSKTYSYIGSKKGMSFLLLFAMSPLLNLPLQPAFAEISTAQSGQAQPQTQTDQSKQATDSPQSAQGQTPASSAPSGSPSTPAQPATQSQPSTDSSATTAAQPSKSASPSNAIPGKVVIDAPCPVERKDKDRDKDKDSTATAKPEEKSGKTAKGKKANPFPDCLPCLTYIDPDQDQKAALVCVHGLGLNSNAYEDFGNAMSKRGYLVYSVDMPGFGSFQKTNDDRGRVDFVKCMDGLKDTLRFIHKANPNMPVYILGESMGGAIALRFSAEYPDLVDGLISSVPSGDRFNQSKEALRIGLKLLTAPNKEFDIGTSIIEKATQDCGLRTKWAEDPLNRMDLSPKELVRFQDFMNGNFDEAKKITKIPVLFVQGCKDKLVRPEGTEDLFNALSCRDRKLELIKDGEHLIFEDGQFKETELKMVDAWLSAHIGEKKQLGSK